MSSAHSSARADPPEPGTWQDLLAAMVHASGTMIIATSRGPVICLDEETYTQLTQAPIVAPGVAHLRLLPPAAITTGPPVRLSPEELEVLQTVAVTESLAAAAGQLGQVMSTMAHHLIAIRRKYQVRSTAAAIIAARADGYLLPVPNHS